MNDLPRSIDAEPAASDPEPLRVAGLLFHHCRWPIAGSFLEGFAFCGCDRVDGFPYCEAHVRTAYGAPSRDLKRVAGWSAPL